MTFSVFFFNTTWTTEIYTLSLHDALPITSERPLITFEGTATSNGRPVDRFSFAFPGSTTYGDGGWQLDLDARTGIALRVAVDYLPSTGIDPRTFTVDGLVDRVPPMENGA